MGRFGMNIQIKKSRFSSGLVFYAEDEGTSAKLTILLILLILVICVD